ncbi:MAG: ABC transporter ATP-binding protein/permease, partial [Lachnospiraceae bacterium]|nr:ABC transporter ATP-binding protein/permease [Lachnospiraceae bacterium]
NVIMMGLRMFLRAPGMMVGAIIMAYLMNKRLTMIFAVAIPLLAVSIAALIFIAFPRFMIMQKKLDALNTCTQEDLTNIRIIKSFVREDFENKKFSERSADLKHAGLHALRVVILHMPVMMLAMNLTTLAVVWVGGNQILEGTMPVGDLTAFTTYIVQILMSLMMLAMVLLNSTRATASIRRINEVLETEAELSDADAAHPDKTVTEGSIVFDHVSFSYYEGSSENVLSDINLKIVPGETVGIVGTTGCGKTSLVQLIPRLYDVSEGRVTVSGIDVRDYSLENLRSGVGMVLQKNVLFSGSIEDNLRWGDANATDEEIRGVLEDACAIDFVEKMEKGSKSGLERGGANVSGGQKQRLCIARALLKRPKILILDDSTSAVDTATEARIRMAFYTTLKDTTVIIIAQRISSVMEADKIVVMDDGRIVGIGTHPELMENCEEYREIYESQRNREVTA